MFGNTYKLYRSFSQSMTQVKLDLISLLSNKRGLSHRVRVEKTGRPPEHPTQTVVQRIVKAAEEEVSLMFPDTE